MAKTKVKAPKPRPRLVPTVVDATPETLARESTNHAEAIARLEVRLSLAETPDDGGAGGGAVTDGDYGDVTVSGGGSVWTVDALPISRITGLVSSLAAKPDTTDLAAIAFTGDPVDLVAPVSNADLATMPSGTIKGNLSGVTALPSDETLTDLAAALTPIITGGILAGAAHFGDGGDGAVTFSGGAVTGWTFSGGTYTTTRADWFYTTVSISGGITLCMQISGEGAATGCSGRFFSSGGITVPSGTAVIKINGASALNDVAPLDWTNGHNGGRAGQGIGGIQNAGQNAVPFAGNWYPRLAGGLGGVGGASATNPGSSVPAGATTILGEEIGSMRTWVQASLGRLNMSNPGSISGGGGGGSGGGTTGIAKGGGGGNGGGILIIGARNVTGPGTLEPQARGGNGGDGEAVIGSNAGGGSGGGGGIVIVGFGTAATPSAVSLTNAVAGGTGGAPAGTGSAGGTGATGTVLIFNLGPGV